MNLSWRRSTRAYLSDEALVALLARGDDQALALLYDRYGTIAYTLARQVVRDAALAEDVVQEAFLTLWRTAATYRPELAPPRAYLLMLVHRRAVDIVRREQRRRVDALEPEQTADDPAATDDMWAALERGRVRDAVAALPDEQRELILLTYFEGFTQTELASRLGLPLGTVKSRMFTAMQRLRALLDEEQRTWMPSRS